MRNWDLADDVGHCTADVEAEDAAWICKKLDIPFREVSFVKEYWNEVFSYLVSDYEAGFTPNPDILCNKRIKFDCFFNHAMENIQADAVATGHYARTSFGEDLQFYNPRRGVRLLKAMDQIKDQTFFLSQVNQWALQRSVFPLGDYTKEAVKKIAMAAGFQKIAQKPESAPACHHPSLYTNMFFTGMPHWIHSPPKRLLKDRAWECHMSYQFAVFYRGEECVGSARILRVGPSIYAEYLQKTGPRHLYIPLPSSSKDGKPSPY
ncbi:unnamed protein product [Cyprideis torosa]|uniref:tRNA-5-taurinomethyluridine 2-sulfurtransferase n=1 Tax=Cyprideis torosa TaxID=163714 RepID=A0A7R8ZKG1_9CRUS|nr:unnamed protein product [Cyprideis torosa]CAG0889299.1 unnamed protein product [Cyprideis torosa]